MHRVQALHKAIDYTFTHPHTNTQNENENENERKMNFDNRQIGMNILSHEKNEQTKQEIYTENMKRTEKLRLEN